MSDPRAGAAQREPTPEEEREREIMERMKTEEEPSVSTLYILCV